MALARYSRAILRLVTCASLAGALACGPSGGPPDSTAVDYSAKLADYVTVRLSPDLEGLSESQREMLPLLREASRVMDDLFWRQAYGDKAALLAGIEDPSARRFAEINYGPWDRLDDNRPFLPGFGAKPPGANFYPAGMSEEEFERAADADPDLRSLYTLVKRDAGGGLRAVPYHVEFRDELARAAGLLRDAAALAEDPGFRKYLQMRADAMESGDYQPSDFAWMEMHDNLIDLVIGPIETYEDALFGTKAGEGIIASELEGEGEVSITGFGKFHIRTRAARTGRNPRTGETIQIAAGRYPVFKAGKSLKDRVSG